MVRRHLIIGGSGQLGSAFRRLLPDAAAPAHSELDITSQSDLRQALQLIQPVAIINCSGYTDVDDAEGESAVAFSVNAVGVGIVAAAADAAGIPFVSFSTDYVFDGAASAPYVESDVAAPLNAYGRSKLAGEEAALCYRGSLVVRTSWLFSATHDSFVRRVLHKAARGSIRVVEDQSGSPTAVDDLAESVLRLLEAETTGLVHLAGQPPASRYELARAAVSSAGWDPDLVAPCASSEYPTPAIRPTWSALTSERVGGELHRMRSWRAALLQVTPALLSEIVDL